MTVCAETPSTSTGFKLDITLSISNKTTTVFEAACPGLNGDLLLDCILSATYNVDEVFFKNLSKYESSIVNGSFTSDITLAEEGQCHTFINANPINSAAANLILPPMNASLDHRIFIHDPDFFLLSTNPRAVPGFRLFLPMDEETKLNQMLVQSFETIEHRKLNLARSPCIEDFNYSFSNCIRRAVVKKVGCILPWTPKRIKSKPLKDECTSVIQYNEHSRIYHALALLEQRDIINSTKCNLPCRYREIRPLGDPIVTKIGGEDWFWVFALTLVSTDIKVETEALVYPFTTLVSDFGGSLGLFLGFSFLMLWDWIIHMAAAFRDFKLHGK